MVLLSILQEESMEVMQYLSALFTYAYTANMLQRIMEITLNLEILIFLECCCFHSFFILTIVWFPSALI